MKTQLLCTFTTHSKLNLVVDSIIDSYTILFDKIYVFQNEDDAGQLICTYNIEMVEDYYDGDEAISGTISLHRKKQSNTLYTINALNETIRSLNNGVLDKSFPIPWENYQNNLLLTNEEGLNIIPTKIFKMLKTNKKERLLITKAVDAMRDDPMHITSIVIRRPSKDLTIKTNYMRKQLNKLDVQGDKLISFVEKQIKIKNIETKLTSKKTKHLNVMDTLDTIEVAELMDIIKDLEDSDV